MVILEDTVQKMSASEQHDLISPETFYYRTTRGREEYHPFLVDIPPNSFLLRNVEEWNSLPVTLFPDSFNPELSKVIMNKKRQHCIIFRIPTKNKKCPKEYLLEDLTLLKKLA